MNHPSPHYRSLILAGTGSVGKAALRLGGGILDAFDRVTLIERDRERLDALPGARSAQRVRGDVEQAATLSEAFRGLPMPALFVNLCAGVDTVLLRRLLRPLPVAYIDAGASRHPDAGEMRFSRLMPYTLQDLSGSFPHLLCQGINPGLVEVAARAMMAATGDARGPFSVLMLEEDTLHSPSVNGRLLCGWSPTDLLEEVLRSPTLQVADGRTVEFPGPGSVEVSACDGAGAKAVRAVGHEDVWNLGRLPTVSHALFLYRLHDTLMQGLRSGDGLLQELALPVQGEPVSGTDALTVAVCNLPSGDTQVQRWTVDHSAHWTASGLNGVQVQTATGILFAIGLLCRTRLGALPGTFTGSTIPHAVLRSDTAASLMRELGVDWQVLPGFRLSRRTAVPLRIHPDDRLWT